MKLNLTVRKLSLLLSLAALTASCKTSQKEVITYDILIKKASVVDGTGKTPYYANVLIKADTIALIDRDTTSTYPATRTVDAKGLVLTPGFIDTHAHGDPIKTPDFKNFLSMGVTTICLGQDGFSPNHKDLKVWMDSVDTIKPAVNVALFAGHGTLRLLSGVGYDSIPSEDKMTALEKLLKDALDAGCYGMTTGLEYTPALYAKSTELNRLARIVGAKQGLIMSHLRNEDDALVEASIRELLEQGKYSPVHVSHIKVVYGKGKNRGQQILQLLDSARTSGMKLTADFYPYTASYTSIEILFPDWAKKPNNYQEVLRTRRKELYTFLTNKITKRNGPEATLIGSGPYSGKTLLQISQELKKPFEEVMMDDIGPYGADGAYFIMDEALQQTFLTDPHIMICTDGSPTMRHPRSFGAFARILETYVQEKKVLTLEEAVRKMTGLPAETIGLSDRGYIRQGYKADLLLFDPAKVHETATYQNPHQLAEGFNFVMVNGKVVKEGTNLQADRQGYVLRKGVKH